MTLGSCRVKKEDSVGVGPQKLDQGGINLQAVILLLVGVIVSGPGLEVSNLCDWELSQHLRDGEGHSEID